MNILLVYPQFPDTFWSFKHALKFIDKKTTNPPLGLMTISSMCPTEWERRLIDTNINPLSDEDIIWSDLVFISAMDVQRDSVNRIIKKVKLLDKPIVAGGPLFTGEYNAFPEINTFVLNEGEITFPLFLKDLISSKPLKRVYETSEYANIQESPLPDLKVIRLGDYDSMSIQFSRGCPFHCDFCNVTSLLGHTPRTKSTQQIIAELDQLYEAGWRRNIFFVDDNFIGNKKQIKKEILPALIEWRQGKAGCLFTTEASINLADDAELLNLMAMAGFINVFIGIETPNLSSLEECNKSQNIGRDLVESVKTIQRAGLQVMAGFIVGFDNDPPSIFDEMVDFIQKSGIVTAMVGLLQAPFGTQLYERMNQENRILREMSGDNSDGSTNLITKMDKKVLRDGYFSIMQRIYSPKYLYPRIKILLTNYNPRSKTRNLQGAEIRAFIRSIFLMGFNYKEFKYYWQLFFWTLLRFPTKFPTAITLTIFGYHFRHTTAANIKHFSKVKIASPHKGKLISPVEYGSRIP